VQAFLVEEDRVASRVCSTAQCWMALIKVAASRVLRPAALELWLLGINRKGRAIWPMP